MTHATAIRFCAAALVCALAVSMSPQARGEEVSLTFSGHITERVSSPPDPFGQVEIGDPWTLTYSFDTGIQDVDGSQDAGQYRSAVVTVDLTIGTEQVIGSPAQVCPNGFDSMIAVNLGPDYADYVALMGLPQGQAWAQVSLADNNGTPFRSDVLPSALPSPLDAAFPDLRQFSLRIPGRTEIFLIGEIGSGPIRTPSQVRTRIQLSDGPDYRTAALLVNSELFGPGGVASGILDCPGCEVMGVEPSPFRWVVATEQGDVPEDGEAVLGFILNPGGEVMGVEPSPFNVFLEVDGQTVGEIDFSQLGGTFPGTLGSLDIIGLELKEPIGSISLHQGVRLFDAFEPVAVQGTRASFQVSSDQQGSTVDLVVDSRLFGADGLASGFFLCPGCEVMGVEPSPFRWVVDPPQEDGATVIGFILNPGGEVMGVEPSPFRILAVTDTQTLGALDFSQVTGFLGSLHLSGVRIELDDGSFLPVADLVAEASNVEIDIKPDSDDNTINLGSSGVIPVAILSSLVFDATTVNPDTVRLSGAAVRLAGKSGKYLATVEDVNGDGLDDLLCKVLTEQLLIEEGATTAVLEAQTYDGLSISGADSITIVPN